MDLRIIYSIGSKLQYIKRCDYIKPDVKGESLLLDNLKYLLKDLEELNLSIQTQKQIKELIEYLDKSYKEEEIIRDDDAEDILERVKLWSDRIINELENRVTIEVFTEGTLNYKKMIIGGESFFPEEVWKDLSEISKSDINNACNCLLTKSWTPAVMISLRASEDCIRNLYKNTIKKDLKDLGWKKILDDISKSSDINSTLIGYLHYIRDMRNTAEHPDEIFDQLEAERVFHQVINMAIVIHREIKKLNKKEESKSDIQGESN